MILAIEGASGVSSMPVTNSPSSQGARTVRAASARQSNYPPEDGEQVINELKADRDERRQSHDEKQRGSNIHDNKNEDHHNA